MFYSVEVEVRAASLLDKSEVIERLSCDPNTSMRIFFLFFSVNTDAITIILQITHLNSLFAVNRNLLNGFKMEENTIKMTAHC